MNIGFKPFKPEFKQEKIPIYFETEDAPYKEIILRGEGAYPKLLFEVEEIILDVVPLDHTSSFILNIQNDGYKNSNIVANII